MSDKQVESERKRGDFFRDMLVALHGCPPPSVHTLCEHVMCPFDFGYDSDTEADFAECWDEVERSQR